MSISGTNAWANPIQTENKFKLEEEKDNDNEETNDSTGAYDTSLQKGRRKSGVYDEIRSTKEKKEEDLKQSISISDNNWRYLLRDQRGRCRDETHSYNNSWKYFANIHKSSKKMMMSNKAKVNYIDTYIKKHEERVDYLEFSEEKSKLSRKSPVRMKEITTLDGDVKSLTETIKYYI